MKIPAIHETLKDELDTELMAFDTLRGETFDAAKKLEEQARQLRQSVKSPDLGRISTQCTEAYSKTLADIKAALNDWALSVDGGLSPRCQTLALQALTNFDSLSDTSFKDFLRKNKNGGAYAVALGSIDFLEVPQGTHFKRLDQFKPFELFALVDVLELAQDKREMCFNLGQLKQRCDALTTQYSTETKTVANDGTYVVQPFSDDDWSLAFPGDSANARSNFAQRSDKHRFTNARDYKVHTNANRVIA